MFGKKKKLSLAVAACLMLSPVISQAALQGSAGNTIVRNTVTIAYQDAALNNLAATDSIDLTVNTVDAAPNITQVAVSPGTGTTTATGDTQDFIVTTTNQANGPVTVNLSGSDNAGPTNMTLSGTTPSFATGTVFLGSTIIDPSDGQLGIGQNIADTGTITFAVPNDGGVPSDTAAGTPSTPAGTTGDSVINALAIGDQVYLYDGTVFHGVFDVTNVVDPAIGAGTTAATGSVELTNNTGSPITFTPNNGWMIVESKTDTMTVTQGSITDPAAVASWISTISGTVGAIPATTTTVTTNATQGNLTVIKYVRNITTLANNPGGGTNITINGNGGQLYHTVGVTADPTDVLEYLLQVTNGGGSAAGSVIVTDLVPVYTTLQTSPAAGVYGDGGGAGIGTDKFAVVEDAVTPADSVILTLQNTDDEDGGANVTLTGAGDAAGTTAGSTMSFNIGTSNTSIAGGSLAGGDTINIIFRVVVD